MSQQKAASFESLSRLGRHLLHRSDDPSRTHSDFEQWDREVAEWLDENCPGTGFSAQWSSISTSPLVTGRNYYDDDQSWQRFRKAVQAGLEFLGKVGAALQQKSFGAGKARSPSISKRVFLVHGHNEGVREKVARFLEKLGLNVIILHEQPNKGRTIIEKFAEYADVAYAVVLLTADDVGGIKGTDTASLMPRARQNVIFELGYFIGALGRERVCALYESGVEILSDYNGVLYLTLDPTDSWRLNLAKEMKAVGIPVDLND